jgi:hypothetical protein
VRSFSYVRNQRGVEVKPGLKTTEFAFVLLFVVLQVVGSTVGFIQDPTLASIASAVVVAAYAVARGLAKQNNVEVPKDLQDPPK